MNSSSPIPNLTNKDNYNWLGVMEFIQCEYQKNSLKQKEWIFQKQTLTNKINKLEAQMKSNQVVHLDLLKRIQMLQYSLRQERIKKNNNENKQLNMDIAQKKEIPNVNLERKVKNNQHKQFLERILNQIGVEINQKVDKLSQLNQKPDRLPQKSKAQSKLFDYKKESKQFSRVKLNLLSHLDGVRDIFYSAKSNCLASVSEDCLIKFWDINFSSDKKVIEAEPKLTLREYTGPLFAVTGTPKSSQNNLIFTGGSEGIIKVWETPTFKQENSVDSKDILKGVWANFIQEPQQTAIWQLAYNQNKLLTTSSDSTIKFYSLTYDYKQSKLKSVKEQLKKTFINKQKNTNQIYYPTSVDWVNPYHFINGYSNSNTLSLFDINNEKVSDTFRYNVQSHPNSFNTQTNRILYNNTMTLVIAAHEDKSVRLFDYNSKKMIKKLTSYRDSVTGISISNKNKWCLFSSSHDGSVKIWDLRKNLCIQEIETLHLKKFDQTIHNIVYEDQISSLFTAGSDGVIKIFQV